MRCEEKSDFYCPVLSHLSLWVGPASHSYLLLCVPVSTLECPLFPPLHLLGGDLSPMLGLALGTVLFFYSLFVFSISF